MNRPVVEISERAAGHIHGGSLWVFSNEIKTKIKGIKPGTWVDFYNGGNFAGFGYVNPHSLIAGRVVSRVRVQDRGLCIKEKLSLALLRRKGLVRIGAFRGAFSESDDLPGLIVDVYGELQSKVVVAQLTTAGMDDAQDDVEKAIVELLTPAAFIIRADSSIRHLEGVENYTKIVRGDESKLKFGHLSEEDVLFAADFMEGQKTGFFIDQRENRRHLKMNHAFGKRVLDLCCYSGGWGLSALRGGAEHVTFVDQSEDALKLVARGLELNKFQAHKADLRRADVFDFLTEDKREYDVVVADPPAFVKSKKNLGQAVRAYKKLNTLAIKRLRSGGILYTCSCSYHLSAEEFEKLLAECVQKLGLKGRVVHQGLQAPDHPWILNRPESRYLKCLAFEISPLD